MVETMVAWGVTHVFGMVGHSNLGFADAHAPRRRSAASSPSSASATRARPRSRRRPTASSPAGRRRASRSPGPGSTNLLTGLYDAKVDRAPVLAISGQVPSKVLGRGAFQDLDLAARVRRRRRRTRRPCCRDSDHAELMTLALQARAASSAASRTWCSPTRCRRCPSRDGAASGRRRAGCADPRIAPPPRRARRRAVALLARRDAAGDHRRPRRRASTCDDVVRARRAARRAGAHHVQGQGPGRPTTTRSAAGVLGRSGTPVASWLMNESDLLLVFGASFSNHTGIAPYKPIVQVDFDPMALGRFHPVDGARCSGDVGVTARAARRRLAAGVERGRPAAPTSPTRWAIWRAEKARRAADDRGRGVSVGRGVRRADAARPRRRGDRRRRRQQRLLVRPLLRVQAPVGADVGLPRLDRLRLSRPRWARGRPRPTGRSSRSPATAASASTSPSSPPR